MGYKPSLPRVIRRAGSLLILKGSCADENYKGFHRSSHAVWDYRVIFSIEIPPQLSIGKAARILKSLSARFMFQQFPSLKQILWAGNLWEASYFVRNVGAPVTVEVVQRYIQHHLEQAQNLVQAELFPKGVLRPNGKPERGT